MKTYQIKTTTILIAALALSAGCAFSPQTVNLAPTVTSPISSEGKGMTVSVRVTDERPSKSLGRRGTAGGAVSGTANSAAAEITTAQDIAAIVQQEITEGLRKQGFIAVKDSSHAGTTLSVEVHLLDYATSQGFWTGGVSIKGALKAVASRKGGSYENMYRTDKEERVSGVPTAEQNERWINEVLSDVLKQLLDDRGLTLFLTQETG